MLFPLDVLGRHCPKVPLENSFNCCHAVFFWGHYFLILLQSYGAADVILPWQVLRHVQ